MSAPGQKFSGWRKSSYSGTNADCVEIAEARAEIAVRDSKSPQAGHLAFAVREWASLTASVKAGPYTN